MYHFPEKYVTCPYDPSHRLTETRYQRHLIRCQENHEGVEIYICKHSYAHRFRSKEKLIEHETGCPCRPKMGWDEFKEMESSMHCKSSAAVELNVKKNCEDMSGNRKTRILVSDKKEENVEEKLENMFASCKTEMPASIKKEENFRSTEFKCESSDLVGKHSTYDTKTLALNTGPSIHINGPTPVNGFITKDSEPVTKMNGFVPLDNGMKKYNAQALQVNTLNKQHFSEKDSEISSKLKQNGISSSLNTRTSSFDDFEMLNSLQNCSVKENCNDLLEFSLSLILQDNDDEDF